SRARPKNPSKSPRTIQRTRTSYPPEGLSRAAVGICSRFSILVMRPANTGVGRPVPEPCTGPMHVRRDVNEKLVPRPGRQVPAVPDRAVVIVGGVRQYVDRGEYQR